MAHPLRAVRRRQCKPAAGQAGPASSISGSVGAAACARGPRNPPTPPRTLVDLHPSNQGGRARRQRVRSAGAAACARAGRAAFGPQPHRSGAGGGPRQCDTTSGRLHTRPLSPARCTACPDHAAGTCLAACACPRTCARRARMPALAPRQPQWRAHQRVVLGVLVGADRLCERAPAPVAQRVRGHLRAALPAPLYSLAFRPSCAACAAHARRGRRLARSRGRELAGAARANGRRHAWVLSREAPGGPVSLRAGARLAQRDAQLPEQLRILGTAAHLTGGRGVVPGARLAQRDAQLPQQRRVGLVRARRALRRARLRRGRRRRRRRGARRERQLPRAGHARSADRGRLRDSAAGSRRGRRPSGRGWAWRRGEQAGGLTSELRRCHAPNRPPGWAWSDGTPLQGTSFWQRGGCRTQNPRPAEGL